MADTFNAPGQTLGYLYQVRYALLFFLKANRSTDLSLETVDDITAASGGKVHELVQAKHHIKPGTLGDTSADLWKTLRVWMTQVSDGTVDPLNTKFMLVTTSTANEGTAAFYLRPAGVGLRDPIAALKKLVEVAQTSKDKKNAPIYEQFIKFSVAQRQQLFENIYVLDQSPLIGDVQSDVKNELRYAVRDEFFEDFYARLEGWWLGRTVAQLSGTIPGAILHKELSSEIHDLQEEYHADNLPIHYADVEGPAEKDLNEGERTFIHQLRVIVVGEPRIKKAITDYYRAYQQRSKWLREGFLLIGDLHAYERKLVDEWERLFESLKENLSKDADSEERQRLGRQLFNQIEQQLQIHIKPKCVEPYVMRGTYHFLANEKRIGWHPDFRERLKALIAEAACRSL